MKRIFLVLLFSSVWFLQIFARDGFRVMFYNVENFFDCRHDSLKNDFEFLPGGIRGWTLTRFWKKAGNIAKVISAVGEDRFPEIVGLAEVENENCIRRLLYDSPLRNAHYSYVHEESPDPRGIDVCLLYNRYLFKEIGHASIAVKFKDEPTKTTRDILYVCGKTFTDDTLHIFVCHFPSRLGGELESEPYRRVVAKLIREKVDSLFTIDPKSNILIMGDFNDYPSNRSLSADLKAKKPGQIPDTTSLYNVMLPQCGNADTGTNKHQAEWGILDQILLSGPLLNQTKGAHIFDFDFLFVQDERYMGRMPFRTYYGMTYQGGYSDHIPVYVDLLFKNNF